MGQVKEHPSRLSAELAQDLIDLSSQEKDGYKTMIGKTMCTNDFYEGILILQIFLTHPFKSI